MRPALALLLLSVSSLACTRPSPSAPATSFAVAPSAEDQRAITSATQSYVRSHSTLTEFLAEQPVISGEYARVRVVPFQPGTPALWVYLVQQGPGWQGLTMGASFTQASHDLFGIPPDLRITVPTIQTPQSDRAR